MSSVTVRAARQSLGIGQKAVAEYMGVPQSTVSKIETGVINPGNITARNAVALSEILETPVDYLIREESAQISVDNGEHWVTPEEAIAEAPWEVIVGAMSDRYREYARAEKSPCSDLDFLRFYLEIAPDNIVIG